MKHIVEAVEKEIKDGKKTTEGYDTRDLRSKGDTHHRRKHCLGGAFMQPTEESEEDFVEDVTILE